jgi:hypothetical protein
MVDQLEALEEHPQHQRRFLQGELAADTGTLPRTKGLKGVGRQARFGVGTEVLRIEVFRILAPDGRVPVQQWAQDHHRLPFVQLVLAAQHGRLIGIARKPGRGRPQAQRLFEDLGAIRELLDLSIGWRSGEVGAQHAIDLVIGAGQDCRVLQQEVEGEGE